MEYADDVTCQLMKHALFERVFSQWHAGTAALSTNWRSSSDADTNRLFRRHNGYSLRQSVRNKTPIRPKCFCSELRPISRRTASGARWSAGGRSNRRRCCWTPRCNCASAYLELEQHKSALIILHRMHSMYRAFMSTSLGSDQAG